MNRILIILLAVCLSNVMFGKSFRVKSFEFEQDKKSLFPNGVILKKDFSKERNVVIPEKVTYEGVEYTVEKIGDNAFKDNKEVTTVVISGSVYYIDKSAFKGLKSLTEISSLPTSSELKNLFVSLNKGKKDQLRCDLIIGFSSFADCTSLRTVDLSNRCVLVFVPKNLYGTKAWGMNYPFENCKSLKTVLFGDADFSAFDLKIFKGCHSIERFEVADASYDMSKVKKLFEADCPFMTDVYPTMAYSGVGNEAKPEDKKVAISKSYPLSSQISQNSADVPSATPKSEIGHETISKSEVVHKTVSNPDVNHEFVSNSDVDINVPAGKIKREDTFAFLISNENYTRTDPVMFALNDGNMMKQYCVKVLGIPEKNVMHVKDASLNDMRYQLKRIKDICEAYEGDASIIVYYAGHGIPEEGSSDAYLLPVDGYAEEAKTGLSLKELLGTLGEVPARQVTLFMDACFSGTGREGKTLFASRGVVLKPKPVAPKGNLVLFSASQGVESALPYREEGHGMFTYYLLKKLKDTGGKVSLGELAEYLIKNVKRTSVVEGKIQTPTVEASPKMADWQSSGL